MIDATFAFLLQLWLQEICVNQQLGGHSGGTSWGESEGNINLNILPDLAELQATL